MSKPTEGGASRGGKSTVGGGLAATGAQIIAQGSSVQGVNVSSQVHKNTSSQNVSEEMGVGISKAIGPESSFHSEISKSNMMMMMPPIPGAPPNNTMMSYGGPG